MAMMMAGRVLLVCVLCVLWCGAGGGYAWNLDANIRNHYYGPNGVFCKSFPNTSFCDETTVDKPPTRGAASSVTVGNAVPGAEGSDQASGDDSAGGQGDGMEGTVSLGPGGEEGQGKLNRLGEGGTPQLSPPLPPSPPAKPLPPPTQAPPEPPGPSEQTNVPNPTNPGDSVTPGVTREPQSAQQSQLPSAGTAASSDTTQSTPAGGGAEPTSPSPDGQAAASGQGENSAAEGTPDGTPPFVAAVTHGD
ncbi:mucin TcMUCII, putative, partial [Trypanosoma cruzi marinkellei]